MNNTSPLNHTLHASPAGMHTSSDSPTMLHCFGIRGTDESEGVISNVSRDADRLAIEVRLFKDAHNQKVTTPHCVRTPRHSLTGRITWHIPGPSRPGTWHSPLESAPSSGASSEAISTRTTVSHTLLPFTPTDGTVGN